MPTLGCFVRQGEAGPTLSEDFPNDGSENSIFYWIRFYSAFNADWESARLAPCGIPCRVPCIRVRVRGRPAFRDSGGTFSTCRRIPLPTDLLMLRCMAHCALLTYNTRENVKRHSYRTGIACKPNRQNHFRLLSERTVAGVGAAVLGFGPK